MYWRRRSSPGQEHFGQTSMIFAFSTDHLDIAMWLFVFGAADDIQTKSNLGDTPLHAACFCGHLDVARWPFCF